MKRIAILTGAGISAESGISTFRDSNGLWENHKIEDVATPEGFHKNPKLVLDFYNQRRAQLEDCKPNSAHVALAQLEKYFHVDIITQNVDNLHERGGSSNVIHLHGELTKVRGEKDETEAYDWGYKPLKIGDLSPKGEQLRPFIVWFGEQVPMLDKAAMITEVADIFVVIGSSLGVYPAASLINFHPHKLPKFVIDPVIPPLSAYPEIIKIQKSATAGVAELTEILIQKYA